MRSTGRLTDDVMSSINDGGEALYRAGREARWRATMTWRQFTDWAMQDNVLEVAVGLIPASLASAFTTVVSSLTTDVLLPIISLLPFFNRNLDEKFAILRPGLGGQTKSDPAGTAANDGRSDGWHYNTVQQALDDGAVVLAYGSFVDKLVRFFIVGVSLYLIARVYGFVSRDDIIKYSTKCSACRKNISQKAHRCPFCTTWTNSQDKRVVEDLITSPDR